MNSKTKNINDLCKLISNAFDLAVLFINPKGKIMFEHLNKQRLNPLYQNEKQNLFNAFRFNPEEKFNFPVIRKTDFSEKYLTISVVNEETFKGTVLIGPFTSSAISEERINGIINDVRAFAYRKKVFKYYHSLPNIKHDKLINISIVIFDMFNNVLLSPETVKNKNKELLIPKEKEDTNMNLYISKSLQTEILQYDRAFETKVLEIVEQGRVEDLKKLAIVKDEEDVSILSKTSHIRSLKNHIITLITLVSIAAIDGGLDHEIAILLRDKYILGLEELNKTQEIRSLATSVLFTYTEKVLQVKNKRYSKTIATCVNYINKNVYEEISHNDIAQMINLSPKYLSALFRKEVGITISQYIQQSKIEEAKKMLAYSSNTILNISSLLNFSDQSYFTKVFKKFVGVTPKIYREKHHLLEENAPSS